MNATHRVITLNPGVNSGLPVTRVSGSLEQCEAYAALCRSRGWYLDVRVVPEVA